MPEHKKKFAERLITRKSPRRERKGQDCLGKTSQRGRSKMIMNADKRALKHNRSKGTVPWEYGGTLKRKTRGGPGGVSTGGGRALRFGEDQGAP